MSIWVRFSRLEKFWFECFLKSYSLLFAQIHFYSSKCDHVVPAGCLLCLIKKLLCKQRKCALWFLRLLLPFSWVFVTAQIVFFFHRLFTQPLKQSGGGEREESTVELRNYAPIILLPVVIWFKVEMSVLLFCSCGICLFYHYLAQAYLTCHCILYIVCMCVQVYYELTVLPNPFGGVWTDCVFHLVKVFRLQIQRVGFS